EKRRRAAADPVFAVARDAFLRIDLRALRGGAAAGRKSAAVGHDARVPRGELGGGDGLAEIRTFRAGSAGAQHEHEESAANVELTRKHASPPRWRPSTSS